MVNRPDSSSTRSSNSSKSMSKTYIKNSGGSSGGYLVRSKSGNDYNSAGQNKLRNSASLQSIAKASRDKSGNRNGLKKYKSNSR